MKNSHNLINKILEAKNGDQGAFSFLLHNFWNYVYNYQLTKIKNDIDAEDLTIQTFAKAFDKINTFNTKFQFKTWLIAISKNVYIDFLRKKKPTTLISISKKQGERAYNIIDNSLSIEDKLIKQQNLENLLIHIKKLKPKYQKVIFLRFFKELTYKEISIKNNEPLTNVKVKLLRAKKILAEIIKKQ